MVTRENIQRPNKGIWKNLFKEPGTILDSDNNGRTVPTHIYEGLKKEP